MLKTEKKVISVSGLPKDLNIGSPAIICVPVEDNFRWVRTSPLENYSVNAQGDVTLKTKNSIYRGSNVKFFSNDREYTAEECLQHSNELMENDSEYNFDT